MIQPTIDGRYQVVARIATGGMGEVYRAHDAVLGREVALKVLHPQLAGDRGFVDRFRREARSAAILNHSNIVGVYDWGSTDGTYFMIMEFVRGATLRALLAHHGRLEPAQVVEVALPVLAALDHAHRQGIVHRDVKPENILVSYDGTVKVGDFGLARAYADSYVSQAEGTVTGTVQYLAPEQIEGRPADPRSDLYAFGVVLFELLTGRPLFTGETSLAIAYQHLTGRVTAPSAIVPGIPRTFDQLVLRMTAKDPQQRPASAATVRQEIIRLAAQLPPAPTLRELAAQIPATELVPDERAPTVTIPKASAPRSRGRRLARALLLVLLLIGVVAAGAWATWTYAIPHYANIPNVTGLTVRQASERLEDAGFRVVIGDPQFSATVPSGDIITTRPPPGTRTRTGRAVVIVQSLGPEFIAVPTVVGETEANATTILRTAGFTASVSREYSDDVPEGVVMSQDPEPGFELERGSAVEMVVSRGPAPVELPDLSGQTADAARRQLEDLGLVVRDREEFSNDVPSGVVIELRPPAGTTLARGDTVTLVVSKGPKTFPMPDVQGMSREEAIATLEGLGLVVSIQDVPTNRPPNTVVYQEPAPNTTVEQGQTVTIFVTTA